MFGARVLAFSTVMLANLGAMPILASGQLTGGKKPVVVFDHFAHVSLAYHKPVIADETQVETIAHMTSTPSSGCAANIRWWPMYVMASTPWEGMRP